MIKKTLGIFLLFILPALFVDIIDKNSQFAFTKQILEIAKVLFIVLCVFGLFFFSPVTAYATGAIYSHNKEDYLINSSLQGIAALVLLYLLSKVTTHEILYEIQVIVKILFYLTAFLLTITVVFVLDKTYESFNVRVTQVPFLVIGLGGSLFMVNKDFIAGLFTMLIVITVWGCQTFMLETYNK